MRRSLGTLAIAALVTGAWAAEPQESKLDFSGVGQVWKIAGVLEQGREPSAADWTALFRTPGYRELMRRESVYREDVFKANLRLVFAPSQAAALQEALENKRNSMLAHFVGIKKRATALRRFQSDLERGDVLAEAVRKAGGLLPPGAMDREPAPPVSFIFFGPDGRGYVPIIIDLLYAADQGEGLVDFIAHEVHHFYRNRNLAYDEGDIRVIHRGLLNGLNQLQIEGVADQIDKHERFFRSENPTSSDYADRYRSSYAESPRILAEMNRLLEAAADAPSDSADLMGILPLSGHPTGYYMARAIVSQGDTGPMTATLGNPFAFVYLYNRAALESRRYPAFSRKAVAFLQSLERAYCPKPEEALAREAAPAGFDSSAVHEFWNVADRLGQGHEPTREEWDRWARHPAYRELERREGSRYAAAVLEDRISLVFKPSRADELRAIQEKGADSLTRHFVEVKAKRKQIASYLEPLGEGDWLERILSDVRPYLPQDLLQKWTAPVLAPVFFSPDLRYGYSLFIFDPVYGSERKSMVEYYARLFVLRDARAARLAYDPVRLKTRHEAAMGILEALEMHAFMESIMPKNGIYDSDPSRREAAERSYQEALGMTPEVLERLDQSLALIGRTIEKTAAWSSLSLRDLPSEGRSAGLYMARVIIGRFGRDRLAATLGNPFDFIRLYNEAATSSPGRHPRFGEQALGVIEYLEREYRVR